MRNRKQCSYCRKVKNLEGFHNHARTFDGKQTRCKPCNGATRTTFVFTPLIPIEVDGKSINHRECKDCGDTLPLNSFYSNGRGGVKPRCKMCYNARIRKGKAILKALKGM
ncbi:hypothetical protein [Bacillus cereus]|uniref:hypothetical protein n=1 Tax=Bacillus cereus TaxID=1396 RepID=UPI0020C0FDCE|nr:hypothetical protein [Bacillus cereus]